ncbi:hypothetical protein QBC33DRAFT_124783 [Phialemonium atrogriseum]|uniref:Transmembrane protein n=1 Tax=Phialemonium atrogriseum TaxID=1093897 RepID=A0AAJ0BWL4_9PEZI|nr:uncharacterized protein QBC33DRAFT_124783 [Phialemonium atrogriseum]KAK1765601.1 hypothetical protein QBC33DRAFT_124783 [Phialemonium atrogriseum]
MSQKACPNGAANSLEWPSQDTAISKMDQCKSQIVGCFDYLKFSLIAIFIGELTSIVCLVILYESWLAFSIFISVAWRSRLDVRKIRGLWFGMVAANSALLLYKGTRIGQDKQQIRTFMFPWAIQFFVAFLCGMVSLQTLDGERGGSASKGESAGKDKSLAVPQKRDLKMCLTRLIPASILLLSLGLAATIGTSSAISANSAVIIYGSFGGFSAYYICRRLNVPDCEVLALVVASGTMAVFTLLNRAGAVSVSRRDGGKPHDAHV